MKLKVGSDEITLHVTSDASDGALVACDVTIPAGGGPPAMHRHPSAEVYRGDEGVLAIYLEDDGGERASGSRSRPATSCTSPAGARTRSATSRRSTPARTSRSCPGRRWSSSCARSPRGPQDVVALAERHGIEFTGPVPE